MLLHWVWKDPKLSHQHERVLDAANADEPLLVSTISLWEIATLYSLNRINVQVPLRDFLEQATAPPLVRRVDITPAIAAEVATLPDAFHRDPGDRLIVATAKVFNATLLTDDRRIIDAGLVSTL